MKFTESMVDKYADKLLIGLTSEENKMVLDELDSIDHDIDEVINGIEGLENIEPLSWPIERDDYAFREDVVEESIPIEELLSNADKVCGDVIEVAKVVD